MISIPLLLSVQYSDKEKLSDTDEVMEISQRTEEFTTAKNLLNSAADAVERIMTSYKEIIELTGFTRRVYEMFKLFETVSSGDLNIIEEKLSLMHPEDENETKTNSAFDKIHKENLCQGKVIESDKINSIIVESISVVTPNGDIIVPSLSLKIDQGMNLLITGPNGCGKSSLFRILSGLWTLNNGTIQRPPLKDMFYVPQRPYLAIGSLRDQIIYPDSVQDMRKKE